MLIRSQPTAVLSIVALLAAAMLLAAAGAGQAAGPGVTVSSLRAGTAQPRAGGTLRVRLRLANPSRRALRPRVRFVLRRAASRRVLSTRRLARLRARRSRTTTLRLRLPAGLQEGRWILTACAPRCGRAVTLRLRPANVGAAPIVLAPPAATVSVPTPAPPAPAPAPPPPPSEVAPAPPPPVVPPGPTGPPVEHECGSATPFADAPAASLTAMWARPATGWTGADGTLSSTLPDGRTAWLFGDTFLGGVAANGSRAAITPMVSNTMVVQDPTCLTTRFGGTRRAPEALVRPTDRQQWSWPSQPYVDGAGLRVAMTRIRRTSSDDWGFAATGVDLATFALPGLELTSVVPLTDDPTVLWGAAVLTDGSDRYVFGVEDRGLAKHLHVAKVLGGDLAVAASWRYWDGRGWSTTSTASARVADGVGNQLSVLRDGAGLALVSQPVFSRHVVLLRAPAPEGPWTAQPDLAEVPDPGPEAWTYNATAHAGFTDGRSLLLSYNVNAATSEGLYAQADRYRPRFLRATLPAAP